jgi:hypothetical protein
MENIMSDQKKKARIIQPSAQKKVSQNDLNSNLEGEIKGLGDHKLQKKSSSLFVFGKKARVN